jgi:hypothetical protein
MEDEEEKQRAFNAPGIINQKAQCIKIEHHLNNGEVYGIEAFIRIF